MCVDMRVHPPGVLVFKREGDAMSSDELTVLEVFVAGDTGAHA